MPHDSLGVSNAILKEAHSQGLALTPMQLQKLLYFSNGWHMEMSQGQPLLSEGFKAWQFGPVSESVYHQFKKFGSGKITEFASVPFPNAPIYSADLNPKQLQLIKEIVGIYGNLSGPQMSHLTHQPDTPWSNTWKGGQGRDDVIPNGLINDEFSKLRAKVNA